MFNEQLTDFLLSIAVLILQRRVDLFLRDQTGCNQNLSDPDPEGNLSRFFCLSEGIFNVVLGQVYIVGDDFTNQTFLEILLFLQGFLDGIGDMTPFACRISPIPRV